MKVFKTLLTAALALTLVFGSTTVFAQAHQETLDEVANQVISAQEELDNAIPKKDRTEEEDELIGLVQTVADFDFEIPGQSDDEEVAVSPKQAREIKKVVKFANQLTEAVEELQVVRAEYLTIYTSYSDDPVKGEDLGERAGGDAGSHAATDRDAQQGSATQANDDEQADAIMQAKEAYDDELRAKTRQVKTLSDKIETALNNLL